MRIKAHMQTHIDQERQTMFHDSTEEVKNRLNQMCRTVEEGMANNADVVFTQMRGDYLTVITGQSQQGEQNLPKWVRTIMANIGQIIDEHEGRENKDGQEREVDATAASLEDTKENTNVEPEAEAHDSHDDTLFFGANFNFAKPENTSSLTDIQPKTEASSAVELGS
jgi:hypothetical protein